MAGVAIEFSVDGLGEAQDVFGLLAGFDQAELVDDVGGLLESSTRNRFVSKTAPDGSSWVDWSEDYAATRGSHHSILMAEGDLLDSIASYSRGTDAVVGSNLVYAAHHQIGGDEIGSGIPDRPYLGASDDDRKDITDLIRRRYEELVQ